MGSIQKTNAKLTSKPTQDLVMGFFSERKKEKNRRGQLGPSFSPRTFDGEPPPPSPSPSSYYVMESAAPEPFRRGGERRPSVGGRRGAARGRVEAEPGAGDQLDPEDVGPAPPAQPHRLLLQLRLPAPPPPAPVSPPRSPYPVPLRPLPLFGARFCVGCGC